MTKPAASPMAASLPTAAGEAVLKKEEVVKAAKKSVILENISKGINTIFSNLKNAYNKNKNVPQKEEDAKAPKKFVILENIYKGINTIFSNIKNAYNKNKNVPQSQPQVEAEPTVETKKTALSFLDAYSEYLNKIPAPKSAALDKMSHRLSAIFIEIPSQRLFHMYLISVVVLGLVFIIICRNIILGLVIGAGIASVLPAITLKQIEARRRNMFRAQLTDALMILSSSLKAGLSLIQSIEEVVLEMPQPISQELNLLVRENRMGVPLEETFVHLKDRLKIEELDLVVTAILVARETGGDLTRTFSQLNFTIREKNKLIGRVKSLCTQAKLQGIIMIFLPIAFAMMVAGFNPQFFEMMLKDKIGQGLIVYSVVSEIIGAFLIVKLSKIEV
ncbi:MAG: type II secretion system F family protein [Candidatus Omnitrophota bacterium]|nr:type II secretion system F family protein [Candidatus Omnitrophota bacterium]